MMPISNPLLHATTGRPGRTLGLGGLARAAGLAAAVVMSLALAPQALAQGGHGAHGHADAKASADRGPTDFVDVEVRRIDRDRNRVTLRHGEVKDLDMPPMTMVFRVAEPSLLDGLTDGAKVQVRLALRSGNYVVTEVRPAP